MLGLETRGGLHFTSDFPLILANGANKTLRSAYEAAPQTFKGFSRQTSNPDFKTIARTQLGDAPSLEKVNESGESKRGSVGEAREQYMKSVARVMGNVPWHINPMQFWNWIAPPFMATGIFVFT